MRKLIGIGLTLLVNAMFIGAFAFSSLPSPPDGEVRITDLSNGDRVLVVSRGP